MRNDIENIFTQQSKASESVNEGLRGYMVTVYQYMAGALGLSGIVAFLVAYLASTNAAFANLMFVSPLKWVFMFAPLGIAMFFGFKLMSMSLQSAQGLFWAFAAAMGVSLASLCLVYTGASIARAFFITAGTFGAMSIYGYTTKKDLTSMGSFLIMGVFGIIIASIVNIFMKSHGLDLIISVLSVLIFTGLAAYDTQKIKSMYYYYESGHIDGNTAKKMAIMGALSLYMDFINIFIALLRLFGERRD